MRREMPITMRGTRFIVIGTGCRIGGRRPVRTMLGHKGQRNPIRRVSRRDGVAHMDVTGCFPQGM